ncbi:hypothetical protein E2C01_029491 [Portunus trituberculatus]|uniref:Uncharacterized protein n=1 Tax=Portunus trituberculatus TaxID=210409 RepID=A0A5B7ES36_PORTR|nr:hypothetical protein [Portunus trituberculatus]
MEADIPLDFKGKLLRPTSRLQEGIGNILLSTALLRNTTHGEHGLGVQHGEVCQEVLCEPQGLAQDFMVRMILGGVFEQVLEKVMKN